MPTYVALFNWTDQGVRACADTVARAENFAAMVEDVGAKLVNLYWTVGEYDLVGIIEAPDDETVSAALLRNCAAGNVRTTTLRAFTRDETARIIAKATG
ncbi:GYD domain-containing protein [Actinomadura rubrobrunea]|uniref:GYD domain-containing protein n=1 Tax=Actinomadura rubrobrunea TaxID=115335 RepID=A0A9W6PT86_9ACTN|nr:GYD domain-containing protein [Actinomadura rubrobrunea]GLW63225.1 GYD domain-containing protein [Actinomadura rubrobrunea]